MGKVNLLVKYSLINQKVEYNIKGILIDQKLVFLDSSDKMIFDFRNLTFERIEEEIQFIKDKLLEFK